jgi:hypothetical protein
VSARSLPLRIGGKIGPLSGDPIDARCTVKALMPDMKMTGLAGTPMAMGDSALIETAGIEIALITLRNQAMGTDLFTQLGCDLAAKKIIVVKSSQHFYASFSKVAKHVIYVGAPGAVTLDLNTLPYTKVRRRSGRCAERATFKRPRGQTTLRNTEVASHNGPATCKRFAAPVDPRRSLPMKRPLLAAVTLLSTALLLGGAAAQAQTKTLRFVPHADLKILDPSFTTAYITRNFGYMVYDTLFAQDAKGTPKPQMVDKYTTSKDGKQWSFTLRPGLKFHDGSAVTAADCVASLQRWGARDSIGRAMGAAGAEWKAVDANNFTLTLKEPFGLVLDALAKPSGFPP